jgi:hypothetical protein
MRTDDHPSAVLKPWDAAAPGLPPRQRLSRAQRQLNAAQAPCAYTLVVCGSSAARPGLAPGERCGGHQALAEGRCVNADAGAVVKYRTYPPVQTDLPGVNVSPLGVLEQVFCGRGSGGGVRACRWTCALKRVVWPARGRNSRHRWQRVGCEASARGLQTLHVEHQYRQTDRLPQGAATGCEREQEMRSRSRGTASSSSAQHRICGYGYESIDRLLLSALPNMLAAYVPFLLAVRPAGNWASRSGIASRVPDQFVSAMVHCDARRKIVTKTFKQPSKPCSMEWSQ